MPQGDPSALLGVSTHGIWVALATVACVALFVLAVWLVLKRWGRTDYPVEQADGGSLDPAPSLWDFLHSSVAFGPWHYTADDYYLRVVVTGDTTRQIERIAGAAFVGRAAGIGLDMDVMAIEKGSATVGYCHVQAEVLEWHGRLVVREAQLNTARPAGHLRPMQISHLRTQMATAEEVSY